MYANFWMSHLKDAKEQGENVIGLCPFHEDKNPSFSGHVETGKAQCFGCKWKGNAKLFAEQLNINIKEVQSYKASSSKIDIDKVYSYTDENGKEIYQIVRYIPKKFSARYQDTNGRWINKEPKGLRTIYKLHEVVKAKDVFIVEGEKDADRLSSIGFVATTNTFGANTKWSESYNRYFDNKVVYLIADADKAGIEHIRDIGESLLKRGKITQLKVIDFQYTITEDKGKDVSDYLNENSIDNFKKLVKQAVDFLIYFDSIDSAPVTNILDLFPNMVVLGELENGEALLFSKDTQKTRNVKIANLTNQDIILMSGKRYGGKLSVFKNEVAFMARKRQLSRYTKLGTGIFKHKNFIICVNGKKSFICRDGKILKRINFPIWKGYQFEFGQQWLDLRDYANFDRQKAEEIFNKVYNHFSQWKFYEQHGAKLLTALSIATPMQALFPWKPHVYLTGKRGTGKTTLFEANQELYGKLGVKIEGSITEASLRQKINNRSVCVSLDEFEKFKSNREFVLKLLRVSNKGGVVIRGTASGHSQDFYINNIVWLSSIEVALKEAADLSRFIIFHLKNFEDKGLRYFGENEIKEISKGIFYIGLKFSKEILEKRSDIISSYNGAIDSRLLESYAVPLAIIETMTGEKGIDLLNEINGEDLENQIQEDEERLLETIVSTKVTIKPEKGNAIDISIGELIIKARGDSSFNDHLKLYGLSLTYSNRKEVIAFNPQLVQRNLLDRSDFSGLNIKDTLKRIDGATESRVRFSGRLLHTVCIEFSQILNEVSSDTQGNVPF